MNETVVHALGVYEPDRYYCANIPLSALQRCFKFTPTEAQIVHALLREYKYDLHPYKGSRQHIFNIRRKLSDSLGYDTGVLSFGYDFYAIPDEVKRKMVKLILTKSGTSATVEIAKKAN